MASAKKEKKGGARKKKKSKPIQFQIGWGGLAAIIASTICVLLWIFVLGFWVGQKIVGTGFKTTPEVSILERAAQPAAVTPPETRAMGRSKAALAILDAREEIPTEDIPHRNDIKPEEPAVTPTPENAAKAEPEPGDAKPAASETAKKTAPEKSVSADRGKNVKKAPAPARKQVVHTVKKEKEPAPSGPYVTLQIASFQDRGKAMREAERWKRKGYDATYKRVNLGGKGVWFRVYVGHYPTFEKARAAARRLARKEHVQPYVKSIR